MPITRVMGLDPGSETTGYGIIDTDGRKHVVVEFGAIRSTARMAFPDRLLNISSKLETIIERTRPECFAIEETFYAVNIKTALKLGHVRGAAIVAAARLGLTIFEYSPLEIKSAIVGYGRAEKHQVQEMVKILLRMTETPQPHDAADALAVAICHIHRSATATRISNSASK
jgi:crossover junction endodeoxyribonuclease RuvC